MPDWAPEIDRGRGPIVPFHQSLFLQYGDAWGDASERRITTRSLRWWGENELAIWCWCHEREATRTFLASRVQALTDLETGEVYADSAGWLWQEYELWPEAAEFAEEERAKLAEAEAASAAQRAARAEATARRQAEAQAKREQGERLRALRCAVLCLVYVAKADGRMDAAEREVIAGFVFAMERELDVGLRWSNVNSRLQKLICDQQEFLVNLKALRATPQPLRIALATAAKDLAEVDGVTHAEEHRAVSWLRVMLARP